METSLTVRLVFFGSRLVKQRRGEREFRLPQNPVLYRRQGIDFLSDVWVATFRQWG
jgi:hypothetical protein